MLVEEPCRIRNQGQLLNLFLLLTRLTRNRFRYTWARNRYLAEKLGVSEDSIGRWIGRLERLGAISVEHVVGIERRIRVRVSVEALKATLFRGDERHRRAAPAAACVAEGPKREFRRNSCQTPPKEGQQQSEDAAASCLSAVVPEASARALAAHAEHLGRPLSHVQLAVSALKARQAAGQAIANPGGYLRRLIEAEPGSLGLPTSPPSHPSERPPVVVVPRIVVSTPKPLPPPTDPALRRLLEGLRQRGEVPR